MFCSNCGTESAGRFCTNCGQQMANPSPPSLATPSYGYVAPGVAPISTNVSAYGQSVQWAMPDTFAKPMVTFGQAVRAGFKGYVIWNARSTRAEYWWWVLFNVIVLVPAAIIDAFATFGALQVILFLGLFLPNLSVLIRRLHDTNKNGGWYWIQLIPIAGVIVIFVFTLLDSYPGSTKWDNSLIET